MPGWQYGIWSAAFGTMILVALAGNILVIWIVAAHKKMWTSTNCFLVSLSSADLLMASLNCAFNFVYMAKKNWQFGEIYCKINNFTSNLSVAASVFSLTAIAFDRYFTLADPFRSRMSCRRALLEIALIWILSCCLSLPCLFYATTLPYTSETVNPRIACILAWPDGIAHYSTAEYVYNVVLLLVTYIGPIVCMAVLYATISRRLWATLQMDDLNEQHKTALQSKRKVVRMLIVLVILFAICWLPYHMYFIWVYHDNGIATYRYIQHIYLAFYWLAMANSMINPIIYYCLNARFRNHFYRIFYCFTSAKQTTVSMATKENAKHSFTPQGCGDETAV